MIVAKDLHIGYNINTVQEDLNFRLEAGKSYALIGPNGVGKSTLIRTIASIQPALKGQVLIDDKDVSEVDIRTLAHTISIVLTNRPQVGAFSVRDIVEMGRTPYLMWNSKLSEIDNEKVKKAIDTVGITQLQDRNVNELSDGQFQKVMIAKALAQDTPVLILDEPSSFLDLNAKINLYELIETLCKEHRKLVLLSSHEIQLAQKHVDQFLLMHENGLELITSNDLYTNPTFKSSFEKFQSYLS